MLKKIYNFLFAFIESNKSIASHHIHPTARIFNRKNLIIAKTALISEYVIIRAPESKLIIGENTQIGPFSVIFTYIHDLKIGNNVMIAPHCVIASGNHNYHNIEVPMRFSGSVTKGPIIIGDDVWIGANCTITDNVKIGHGAVIGANSLVNKDVKPYEVVGGVPIKHILFRK